MLRLIPLLGLLACTPGALDSASDDVPVAPGQAFEDDCSEALNDSLADAMYVSGDETLRARICADDLDYYVVEVPAESYLSFEVAIDGRGKNKTDLDLFELEAPDRSTPGRLDLWDELGEDDVVWQAASSLPEERLAWYNPSSESELHYVAVDGYEGAEAEYDIVVNVGDFHEGYDCDEFVEDTSEDGPCNEILQFPQASNLEDGYVVSHPAQWSSIRREVIYLVRHAAEVTRLEYPDVKPLGLLDMGERNGETPGEQEGDLRHPSGTHVNGNDIDIAYFQTGRNNLGRTVCPDDGYFCTGEPDILDAEKTAFFMAQLFDSKHVRVIGVDPEIYDALQPAADALRDAGKITKRQRNRLSNGLAYGDGWPFHQHHMHFSWDWEDGFVGANASPPTLGCGHDLVEDEKQRLGPGR